MFFILTNSCKSFLAHQLFYVRNLTYILATMPDHRKLTRDDTLNVITADSSGESGAASLGVSANQKRCHSRMTCHKSCVTLAQRTRKLIGYAEAKDGFLLYLCCNCDRLFVAVKEDSGADRGRNKELISALQSLTLHYEVSSSFYTTYYSPWARGRNFTYRYHLWWQRLVMIFIIGHVSAIYFDMIALSGWQLKIVMSSFIPTPN